ncbi:very short patch repair endonuclease [Bradyrhizobium yuanmingense]|uniref:very short patch repair endonuclease n=1 Tax=Bradyrhizobium yuanmingense TaxID=108015 RepID=UPI0009EBF66D|nr:very short patch repair endonuclease [Bradyrhizobium yuanmingense]
MSKRVELADPISPATTRRMSRTAQRDNSLERALRSELHGRGLRFRLHQRLLADKRRTVDIAFPRAKVAVFVDGCFWHGCPKHGTWPKNNRDWWRAKIEANIARDRDTDKKLTKAGWIVLRVWAHEAVEDAADAIERIVLKACGQRAKTRP